MNILKPMFRIRGLLSTNRRLCLTACLLTYFLMMPAGVHAEQETDTLFVPSVRFGVDLSGFARQLFETETLPVEFSADVEWRENFFIAAEGGWLTVDVNRETHRYQASGYFFRLGHDFSIFRGGAHNPNDVFLVSLRYGYGRVRHEAPHIVIPDPYWGDYETSLSSEEYAAHWLEAGIGMKAEVLRNLFLGWSLRGRVRIANTSDPLMQPYIISGFGKSDNSALMVHYSIYYRIPLY